MYHFKAYRHKSNEIKTSLKLLDDIKVYELKSNIIMTYLKSFFDVGQALFVLVFFEVEDCDFEDLDVVVRISARLRLWRCNDVSVQSRFVVVTRCRRHRGSVMLYWKVIMFTNYHQKCIHSRWNYWGVGYLSKLLAEVIKDFNRRALVHHGVL